MNPRIYKKLAKRALELLRSHGAAINPESIFLSTREDHPLDVKIKGAPISGYMSGYYEPEWHEDCPFWVWIEIHYWAFVVPEGWNGITDKMPGITRKQLDHRKSTRAIAAGWKWRGGKAMKEIIS